MKQTVRIEDLKPGDKTAGGAIVQPASDDTTGRPKRLEWHENGERFWLAMENCRRVFGPTVEVTREEDPLEPFEATVIDWCYEDGCLRLSVDDPYPDEDALEFGSKVYVRPAGYVEPKPPLPQDVAEAMYHLATCGIEWVQTLLQFIRDNWPPTPQPSLQVVVPGVLLEYAKEVKSGHASYNLQTHHMADFIIALAEGQTKPRVDALLQEAVAAWAPEDTGHPCGRMARHIRATTVLADGTAWEQAKGGK